jgi:hypothetical protein
MAEKQACLSLKNSPVNIKGGMKEEYYEGTGSTSFT